jgi:hypothetical protein
VGAIEIAPLAVWGAIEGYAAAGLAALRTAVRWPTIWKIGLSLIGAGGSSPEIQKETIEETENLAGIGKDTISSASDELVEDTETALTRVGRWMSAEEHDSMTDTGLVQEGGGGTTYVANPADPAAYEREAATGSRYVEFDVPEDSLAPASKEGWAQIPGPNSIRGRLAAMQGKPIPGFPAALNMKWLKTK